VCRRRSWASCRSIRWSTCRSSPIGSPRGCPPPRHTAFFPSAWPRAQVPGGGEIDGTTKLLILLAERDLHAADLTEYFLRTEGYQVVGVFDADEALGQPTDAKADLAVIDLLISGGRGLDLCRKLSVDGTPVLAVSTLDMQDQALEAGAGAFLLKPLDPLQLVSTIRDLLRESAYLRGRP